MLLAMHTGMLSQISNFVPSFVSACSGAGLRKVVAVSKMSELGCLQFCSCEELHVHKFDDMSYSLF